MIETCADFFYAFLALVDLGPAFNILVELIKVFIPFFAALLGATLAYRNIEKKHKVDLEIEKLNAASRYVIELSNLTNQLQLFIEPYMKENDPMRGLLVGHAMYLGTVRNFDCSSLSFIVKSDYRYDDAEHCTNPLALDGVIFANNSLLVAWNKRNELAREIANSVYIDKTSGSQIKSAEDSIAAIIKEVGFSRVLDLLVYTELLIEKSYETINRNGAYMYAVPRAVGKIVSDKLVANKSVLLQLHERQNPVIFQTYSEEEIRPILASYY